MDIQAQRPILPACSLARSHLSGEKQSANTHQCFAMSAFDPSGHCSITSSPGASNDGGTIEAKRASI
jgi:hypothetical protein